MCQQRPRLLPREEKSRKFRYALVLIAFRDFLLSTNFGGATRDRTADPLLAKQVLSQLSYSPNFS
jgi:hypothetical protein